MTNRQEAEYRKKYPMGYVVHYQWKCPGETKWHKSYAYEYYATPKSDTYIKNHFKKHSILGLIVKDLRVTPRK